MKYRQQKTYIPCSTSLSFSASTALPRPIKNFKQTQTESDRVVTSFRGPSSPNQRELRKKFSQKK